MLPVKLLKRITWRLSSIVLVLLGYLDTYILTVSLSGNHNWRGWLREALDFKKKIPRTLNDLWYY